MIAIPPAAIPRDAATPTPGINVVTPCAKSTNPLTTFPCLNYLMARTEFIANPIIGRFFKKFFPRS